MDVAGIFSGGLCGIDIDGYCRGRRCSWWQRARYSVPDAIGDWDHPEAGSTALVATDDDVAKVGNGAVDLGEGYNAAGIAHGNDGE